VTISTTKAGGGKKLAFQFLPVLKATDPAVLTSEQEPNRNHQFYSKKTEFQKLKTPCCKQSKYPVVSTEANTEWRPAAKAGPRPHPGGQEHLANTPALTKRKVPRAPTGQEDQQWEGFPSPKLPPNCHSRPEVQLNLRAEEQAFNRAGRTVQVKGQ
jgi:hypothetical protein